MRLLTVSNGHGEDAIAVQILLALRQLALDLGLDLKLAGLPLVGRGDRYLQAGVSLAGPARTLPSGGFLYMDPRQLVRDVRGGLVGLTLAQLRAVRQWRGDAVLAVGDIVPLAVGWYSGLPYGFVGTAKSEYYTQPGYTYNRAECWLMRRPRCRAVFPRDALTTECLQRANVAAYDRGNPMMDGFEIPPLDTTLPGRSPQILLLPGSRPPEAYANWARVLAALPSVIAHYPAACFLAAAAPGLDLAVLGRAAVERGWQSGAEGYCRGEATLKIGAAFREWAEAAVAAIALAGTATEQFVGLGKPAVTVPGAGPQFTPTFAQAQTQLLGPAVTLVERPEAIGDALRDILADPDRRAQIYHCGRQRLGNPGAAERIARQVLAVFAP